MTTENTMLPCEEFEAHLIEAAFTEMLMQECEELEAQPLTPEEESLLAQAELSRQKHLDMIARATRRARMPEKLLAAGKAALKYAAILLLAANIGLGMALAFSSEFRAKVIEFLTVVTEEYVRIGVDSSHTPVAVPDGWMADYFPTYLPEGYELLSYYSNENHSQAVYTSSSNASILFHVSLQEIETFMNADIATNQSIMFANHEATMFAMNDSTIITWTDGGSYYYVKADSANTSLAVAKSVALISQN